MSGIVEGSAGEAGGKAGRAAGESAVRPAGTADIAAIQAIYAHHVLHGLASFEEEPPDQAEMARRVADVQQRGLPYLVAEDPAAGGAVLGFAYAGPYRARRAYRFTLENSVYVLPGKGGRGIGSALLCALIERCTALGYRQMIAVIGDSANAGSIRLHARHGFRHSATLTAVGFKHGRWVDTILMQRALGPGDETLPA